MVTKSIPSVARYDIWLVGLNPTKGSEVNKTRPCIVVSPDVMNKWIRTVIVVPMTSSKKSYVSRVPVEFQNVQGQAMLDQIRTIDKQRLVKKLGSLDVDSAKKISDNLIEMFQ